MKIKYRPIQRVTYTVHIYLLGNDIFHTGLQLQFRLPHSEYYFVEMCLKTTEKERLANYDFKKILTRSLKKYGSPLLLKFRSLSLAIALAPRSSSSSSDLLIVPHRVKTVTVSRAFRVEAPIYY